jgi:apolipoprotein N-acyltransferase
VGLTPALLALASGVVFAAALPPSGMWPFAAVLAVPFGLIARAEAPREAFGVGALFALGFFGVYVMWLPLSFSAPEFLGPFFWVLYPLLLAVLAATWGLAGYVTRLVAGRGVAALWLLPPLWVLVEWFRSQGYFGFPWGTLGYVWLDTPLAQAAALVGVTGLSLLTAALAAALAAPFVQADGHAGRRRARWAGVLPAVVLGAVVIAGWWWGTRAVAPPAPLPHTALLVQGNVDPFGRAVGVARELDVHVAITELGVAGMAAPPDLVIWPEGALAGYDLDGATAQDMRERIQAAAPGSSFVIGGRGRDVDAAGRSRSYNSAYAMEGGQLVGRYDKHVLVPFGERWPLIESLDGLYRAVFGALNLPMMISTSPGRGPVPLGSRLGPLATAICYESVFPAVSAEMVAAGAQVLVVITNDAWFARGDGARQHLDMGRMRAIETRRYLLRAANDGITAAVDPYGRVTAEYQRFTAGHLAVRFALRDDLTPFVRYGHHWPWALLVSTLLVSGVALIRRAT